METTVKQRLIAFIKFKGLSQSKFEKAVGLSNGFVNNISKSIGAEKLQRILSVFPDINQTWLLTGNGQMLAKTEERFRKSKGMVLPLLTVKAMAGYNEDNWTTLVGQCPLYSIPDIDHNADFLISVTGDSMIPRYEAGDLLACKLIQEILFFQWGKTYVVDTSQGVMVKKLFEDRNNPDNLLLVSDNTNYPPFSIPRSDIRKLALVVGVIRIKME